MPCSRLQRATAIARLPSQHADRAVQASSGQDSSAAIHCLRVWQLPLPPRSPDHLDCPLTAPQATAHHSHAPVARSHSNVQDKPKQGRNERMKARQAAGATSAAGRHISTSKRADAHLEVRQHLRLLLLLGGKIDERERLLLLGGVDLEAG